MFWLLQRTRVSRTASLLSIVVAAALAFFGVSATDGGAASAGSASPLGVYVGYQAPGAVSAFGRALGQSPTFAMDFLDGDSWSDLVNTAPSYMAAWKGSGYTMVWGLPMLPDDSASDGYSLSQGASGAYNSYFLTLAQDMVAGGQGSSIIRPGWEFNGGWFPWAANGQAAAFVGYWQQIVDTMRSVPGQDFTFEWNPTAGDQGVGNLANYYPGNAYVDSIGLDLYDQAFGHATRALRRSGTRTSPSRTASTGWHRSPPRRESRSRCPSGVWVRGQATTATSVSDPGNEVSGGDDPAFINDMAQWIHAEQRLRGDLLAVRLESPQSGSNPDSFAAFVQDFGSGSGRRSRRRPRQRHHHYDGIVHVVGSVSGGGRAPSGSGASGPESLAGQHLPPVRPGRLDGDRGRPGGSVPTWRGAHFSAVVTTATSGTSAPSGSVSWAITSRSGATDSVSLGQQTSSVARNGRPELQRGAGVLTAGRRSVHGVGDVPRQFRRRRLVSFGHAAGRQGELQDHRQDEGPRAVGRSGDVSAPSSANRPRRRHADRDGDVRRLLRDGSGQTLSCAGGDTVSLVSGAATCIATAATAAGSTYIVTATYSGDGTFAASTSRSQNHQGESA